MDAETVAGLLGVKERQLRNYVSQNSMPVQEDGRKRTYNWPEVLEWYWRFRAEREGFATGASDRDEEPDDEPAGKKEDIGRATLRKTRAEADLKELALSQKRGEVIVIADVKVRVDRMMGNLRTRILGLRPKLASRIDGAKGRPERDAAIQEELEAVCRDLSTGEIVRAEPSDENVDLEAAAEDPGEDGLPARQLEELYASLQP